MSDPVNHPSHYTAGGIECIDAIEAALGTEGAIAFCKGNAMKYLWRADLKGNAEQDLRKAAWYVERAATLTAKRAVKAKAPPPLHEEPVPF